jgi:antitoxin HicB
MKRAPKRIRRADNHPVAIKSAVALQVEAAMKEKGLSKSEMARRMQTSRAAINRLLDPVNGAVTLCTLQKAAVAVGREIHLELVSSVMYKGQK